MHKGIPKPIRRSALRRYLGHRYYAWKRYALWARMRGSFCTERRKEDLPYAAAEHQTPLVRNLKSVDMWMQRNKVVNLQKAVPHIDGILIRPGQTFSYWFLIRKPTKRKGYLPGMILRNGQVVSGVGGGLCQLSNLIFWMAIHTPLTVVERHRHGYDVFPDSNRTQPFGSGATCFYPHGDLMLRNDTDNTYQIRVEVGPEFLRGSIRCDIPPSRKYEIVEKNHRIEDTWWGGYCRHNELYQQVYDGGGTLLSERLIVANDAIMMYSPLLENSDSNADPSATTPCPERRKST